MSLSSDPLRDPQASIGDCARCGAAVIETGGSVTGHATGDRQRDHDLDEDHVPYLPEEPLS